MDEHSGSEPEGGARARILRAAADLLSSGGREAASTRAVSAAAQVQAPTLYRQFGDMQGLLNAAARHVFAEYVREIPVPTGPEGDPVEALRRGWNHHIAFGLANPAVYALIYGDPAQVSGASAARDAHAVLEKLVTRVAEAGRLKASVGHSVSVLVAAGTGATLSLIAAKPAERDPALSADLREAVLAALVTAAPAEDAADNEAFSREGEGAARVAARAVALRAVLDGAESLLSPAEHRLLNEWLDRLS